MRSRVICPVEKCLPLAWPAECVTWAAIGLYLAYMASHSVPTAYLTCVFFWQASAHVVPAVPLEPAARIVFVNPALSAPLGQRLRGVDFEKVEFRVARAFGELCAPKPRSRKFFRAVTHIDAAKDAGVEHLAWCEFGFKIRSKSPADRRGQLVRIPFLHAVVHCHFFHRFPFKRTMAICSTLAKDPHRRYGMFTYATT